MFRSKWYVDLKTFLWSDWDGVDTDHLQVGQQRTACSESEDLNSQYSQYDDFQTIDWPHELARDRSRHRFIHAQKDSTSGIRARLWKCWDASSAWVCVLLVGGTCGAIAGIIDIGTGWLSDLKEGYCTSAFWLNREQCCWSSNTSFYEDDMCDEWQPWSKSLTDANNTGEFYVQYAMYVLWAMAFSMLAAFMVHTCAPYAVGGGIPEIKTVLSGYIIRGLLGKWTLIIKTIGVILAVAAGLILGKEGPLVHIACCVGNIISNFFIKYGRNEAKKREILSAAAAAGVSVAFGAPIGGVLFSLEEIAMVTFVTAVVSYPMEYTRIDTSQLIAKLVRNCKIGEVNDLCEYNDAPELHLKRPLAGSGVRQAMWQLSLTFLIKFALLIVTAGIKVPAGLYIPSLAVGAIFGRMIGTGMEQLAIMYPDAVIFQGECGSKCVTPGLYAMVGAAAMLGGITRMTIGLVVIIYEITGGVRYIIPVMTGVMFSKWIGDAVCKQGIFEALIELNDYPFLDIKEEFHQSAVAADIIKPRSNSPLIVLTQIMTLEMVENILLEHNFNGFPVVVSHESQYLLGFVLRKDLFVALKKAKSRFNTLAPETGVFFSDSSNTEQTFSQCLDFSKIVDEATSTITPKTPVEAVVEQFKKLGLRQLLVTYKGLLLGIVTKKDVTHHVKTMNCNISNLAETSL